MKYISWFNDPEVCRYNSHSKIPMTKRRAIEYVNSVNNSLNSPIVWSILFKNKNKKIIDHIGNVCLDSLNWINRSAEFSIIIGDKEYWGKGIATNVLQLILCHAFIKLNLERVWLGTSEDNIGMQKSAIKAGMKREAVLIKNLFINGKYSDSIIFGINSYRFYRLNNRGEGGKDE